MPGRFGAVATAMATPFHMDGSLDVEGIQMLASHLFARGTSTIVAAGTTGESPTLTMAEKGVLWETVAGVAKATGNQMLAGTGTYATAESIELTELAQASGADGVLVVTPYYNKPPQRCLLEHFTAVAGATDLPVVLYNIPGRTATRIEHETLMELAQVDNIVAVKDSTGDLEAMSRVIAEAPEGFELYSGDDWATFEVISRGGAGIISVGAHLVGERIAEMVALIEAGEVDAGRAIHDDLMPLYDALFAVSSPIPLKAALEDLGLPAGPLRLPLSSATDSERAAMRAAMSAAGVS